MFLLTGTGASREHLCSLSVLCREALVIQEEILQPSCSCLGILTASIPVSPTLELVGCCEQGCLEGAGEHRVSPRAVWRVQVSKVSS